MGYLIVDTIVIASTAQMDDNEELRDDSDNERSTREPENNGNDAIYVVEDQ